MNKLELHNLCPICIKEPNSHSFHKISNNTFYTCPSQASKYDDTDGILMHYKLFLENHGPNPWIWIFDSKGFELKHMMELQTAYGIVSLLNEKYGKHLIKIIIINPTWHIHSILTIVLPFLNKDIQSLIEILT